VLAEAFDGKVSVGHSLVVFKEEVVDSDAHEASREGGNLIKAGSREHATRPTAAKSVALPRLLLKSSRRWTRKKLPQNAGINGSSIAVDFAGAVPNHGP
jgi:hypothetical protein